MDEFCSIESDEDVDDFIKVLWRMARAKRISATIHSYPYKSFDQWIEIEGINILFIDTPGGCSVRPVVIDKKKIDKRFFGVWKQFEAEAFGAEGAILQVENLREAEADLKELDLESNKEARKAEWRKCWFQKISNASIPTSEKLQYMFLFAVMIDQGKITPKLIRNVIVKKIEEVDRIANTEGMFQKLAREYHSSLKSKINIKDGKAIMSVLPVNASPLEVVQDIPCITESLYPNIYQKFRNEFEYPNFPKAAL
jgi:hypothetical protein